MISQVGPHANKSTPEPLSSRLRRALARRPWLAASFGLIALSGALLALTLGYLRAQTLASGERVNASLAHIVEEQTARTLQTVDLRLQLAASSLAQLAASGSLNDAAARTLLRDQIKDLPYLRAMWVMNAQGRIAFDSDTGNIGLDLADRTYFKAFSERGQSGFYLGAPVRSRTTGTWLISAARAMPPADGRFAGIIVAALEPSYFDRLWRTLDLDTLGSVALFRRDGVLMARSPFDDAAMTRDFARVPLFDRALPRADSGSFTTHSVVDGVLRDYAFRTLSTQPELLVVVGQSRERMLLTWSKLATLALTLWALASLLMIALCLALDRTGRQRRQEQLRSLQIAARLGLATEAASIGVWEWDLATDQWEAEPFFFSMSGRTPPTGPCDRAAWFDPIHPLDREAVAACLAVAMGGDGTALAYEARVRHADDTWRWMQVSGRHHAGDSHGRAPRLAGVQIDITARQEAAERLRLSEENLAITLQSIGDAVIATDEAGLVRRMNAVAERMTGWPLSEASGRPLPEVFRIVHPVTRVAILDPVERIMASGQVAGLANHTALLSRDGQEYQIADSAAPIRSAAGKVVGVVLVFSDVTERYVAQEALGESEVRYRTLIEWAPVPIAVHRGGVLLYVNPAAMRIFGAASAQDMIGMSILDRIHPDFHQAVRSRLESTIQLGGSTPPVEQKYLRLDGSVMDVEVQGTAIWFDGAIAVCASLRDITERKRADEALRIAATAFESQEGMYVCAADWTIVRVNRAFSEITGYGSDDAVGRSPRRLLASGRHDDGFFTSIAGSLARDGVWQGEAWDRRRSGEVYPAWLTITAVHDDAGRLTHYVATFVDMSARKAAEDQIQNLAFFDSLTGLPNRRLLMDRLGHALAASARRKRMAALLFVDLDHFKNINDTLGHFQGDLLLQEVARRLKECTRQGDTLARLGGDEFVVMLEDLSADALAATTQAEVVGEKIQASLNRIYHLAEQDLYSSASIGITLFDGQAHESIDEPLMHADLAMYQAKAAGRNTLRFFDQKMQAVVTARTQLERSLREAVQAQQFLLHYQAQVDQDGRIIGAEALVRWQHPERGIVSPAEFIPLAEETGLILPLGHWVLQTACAQLADWRTRPAFAHLDIAVNVSARQFRQETFVAQVLDTLAQSRADPHRLKLELTEGMLVENVGEVIARMHALKSAGVRFALDDFGTGYSSLAYLKQLPLDQLKIDRSFVKDILTDPNDAAISRMVVVLAESLGLDVIAEGVETLGQRDLLAVYGCRAHQGFLFSRPVAVEFFERLVLRDQESRPDGAVDKSK